MFEINRENHSYDRCQVCGADKAESANINIYSIKLMNRQKCGMELHLCSHCCNVLSDLTKEPDKRLYGIRMMSIDELEEVDKVN